MLSWFKKRTSRAPKLSDEVASTEEVDAQHIQKTSKNKKKTSLPAENASVRISSWTSSSPSFTQLPTKLAPFAVSIS